MSDIYDGADMGKERLFSLLFNIGFSFVCVFIVICAVGGFFTEHQTSPTYLKAVLVIVSLFGVFASYTNYRYVCRRAERG